MTETTQRRALHPDLDDWCEHDEIADTCKRCKATAGPHEYRVTFGGRYPREEHPLFPAADKDGWLTVLAWDYREAHEATIRAIGKEWCNVYAPHYGAYPVMPKYYPKGELGFLDATVPASQQSVVQR